MSPSLPSVPRLADDEIHVWQRAWVPGTGDAPFIDLLAAYTGVTAPPVERGSHGKPRFPAPLDTLGFNWSHSGDIALFAVGRGQPGFEVGVDVEQVRPRARALELARRFFAPDEAEALTALPADALLDGFLRLWTAKEAVLKAHGGGLSYGLHRVAFAVTGDDVAPREFDGDIAPASGWRVHPLSLGRSVVAATAWRGTDRSVRVFTYPI